MLLVMGVAVIALFTKTPAQDGDDSPNAVSIFNQAQDLHEKGDLKGAIVLYDKAVQAFPEFPEANYQRGVAELALGNQNEAEISFRRAVELKPDWSLAMISLSSLLVKKAEYGEAEQFLKRVTDIEPQNPAALVALAELHWKRKAPPEVLQNLLISITNVTSKANPTAALWSAKANLETALGNKSNARASVVKALAIDPKYRNALFQAADFALTDNDIERAKQIAEKLEAQTDPDSLNLLKANISAAEGNLDEAIKWLDEIKTPGPDGNDLRSRIAAARATNAAQLEKLLQANNNDPSIVGRLCTLYRRDDPAKALAYCLKASQLEPNNVSHAVGYGAALVQAKQFESAVKVFTRLLKIAPENSTIHANMATALLQLKQYPEAKAEFQWLADAQPKAAAPYFFLGIVYDQLDEYPDAMANYQQYLKLADPVENKLDIEKVNLRLPLLQKQIKNGKGKNK